MMATHSNYYSVAADDVEVNLDILNLENKGKYHHNVGYYSDRFVSIKELPPQVKIGNDSEVYDLVIKVLNFAYDTQDLIVQKQKTIMVGSNKPHSMQFALGEKVYTPEGQFIGAITNHYVSGGVAYYPIGAGISEDYIHFSNVNSVKILPKLKRIAYAGEQFDTKEELVQYLQAPTFNDSNRHAVFYLTQPRDVSMGGIESTVYDNCQLIVYEKGINVVSIHFRVPLVNSYNVKSTPEILGNFKFHI